MKLKKLLITVILASSVSSCGWIWNKSNSIGDMLPVYDKSKRCGSAVYCTTKDYQQAPRGEAQSQGFTPNESVAPQIPSQYQGQATQQQYQQYSPQPPQGKYGVVNANTNPTQQQIPNPYLDWQKEQRKLAQEQEF